MAVVVTFPLCSVVLSLFSEAVFLDINLLSFQRVRREIPATATSRSELGYSWELGGIISMTRVSSVRLFLCE